jgi:hypothetical protein
LADVSLGWLDLIRGKSDFLLDNIGQSISATPHFLRSKKTASILAGGETVPFRQHLVSDFLIGAQAKVEADRLITRTEASTGSISKA